MLLLIPLRISFYLSLLLQDKAFTIFFKLSQTIYCTRTLITKIKSGRKMREYNRGVIAVVQ
jgi:hypothetical protein